MYVYSDERVKMYLFNINVNFYKNSIFAKNEYKSNFNY